MSTLAQLTTKRMELFALEREECAGCGHFLSLHAPRMSAPDRVCHAVTGTARTRPCKCKGWTSAADQLALGVKK